MRTGGRGPQVNPDFEEGLQAVDGGADVNDLYLARALVEEAEWQIEHGDIARAEVLIARAASVIERGVSIVQLPLARLYRARARVLAAMEGPTQALDYLERPTLDPAFKNHAVVHAVRAELWHELGEPAQAENAARAAVNSLSHGPHDRRRRCTVRTALVRVTTPTPDPNDLAKAVEACDTDPPRPEAAFLETLTSAR